MGHRHYRLRTQAFATKITPFSERTSLEPTLKRARVSTVHIGMANSTTATMSYPFVIDGRVMSQARSRAAAFAPTGYRLAVGVALEPALAGLFFDKLAIGHGPHSLTVGADGISITALNGPPWILGWNQIDRWAADKKFFMARSLNGQTLLVPRADIPEHVFAMILEICQRTAKSRRLKIGGVGNFGAWSQLGRAEKIVRGIVFGIGGVLLTLSLLIFAAVGI